MAKRLNIFSRSITGPAHLVGYIILLLSYTAALIVAVCRKDLTGIGIMGMMVFLGSMIGGSLLSEKGDLSSGEVRRSITISFILVYFALLAFSDNIEINEENSLITKAIENFWVFIVAVIAFYFGGRSLERAAEKRRDPDSR
jgi:hypothetical protein